MILSAFVMVFVVVYLYYTINDVKRLSLEVKKNTTDISKLTQDIQNAMNVLTNLNNDVMAVKGKNIQCELPPPKAEVQVLHDDDAESEQSSVDSEILQKIIVGDESDEEEKEQDEEEVVTIEPTDDPIVQKPDFKTMKYEELREEAKRRGVSTKGTKDQLIVRLEALN